MASKLACAAKTDVGLKRTNNEDNFAVVHSAGLYVLADGMGGHASGQVASTMCVQQVAHFVCEMSRQPGFKLSFPTKPEWSFEAKLLANAIMYANERVFIQSCKDRSMEGMGTTVTAIFNAPHGLVLAHVGDSRIYRVRKGEITQMTRDHSLMNHLIDKGELRPEDAPNFANKNVILRAIGLKDEVEVDIKEVPREKGDVYMMCSDGLSDLVSDAMIGRTISEARSLEEACSSLIGLALNAGGKDNVTVVCVSVEEDDAVQQPKPQAHMAMGKPQGGMMPNATPQSMGNMRPGMRPMGLSPAQPNAMGMGQMHPQAPAGMAHAQMPMGMSPGQMAPGMSHAGMAPSMNAPMGAQMRQPGPQGMRPSMVGMPAMQKVVPSAQPMPSQSAMPTVQRMHSVREIVETKPTQRAMPKPIGSAGRNNSTGMPAVMHPTRVKPVESNTHPSQEMARPNDGEKFDANADNPNIASAASPKEVVVSQKVDKEDLPDASLLFTAPPPSAAPDTTNGDALSLEDDTELYGNGGLGDIDEETSDIKTMLECPIISEGDLHAPPPSLNIPGAVPARPPSQEMRKAPATPSAPALEMRRPAPPNTPSRPSAPSSSRLSPVPAPGTSPFKAKLDNDLAGTTPKNGSSTSAIYECDDDDDSIIISQPVSNYYISPKEAITPPKEVEGDSIEISPDLYDDDEDSVTKTFKPTFNKW